MGGEFKWRHFAGELILLCVRCPAFGILGNGVESRPSAWPYGCVQRLSTRGQDTAVTFWPACRSSLISVVVAGFPAMPHSPLPTSSMTTQVT